MTLPAVSIVIPAYNYAEFVAETLCSALGQDYPGLVEVLVVDDGSTDDTPQVVAGFGARVRCHRKENAGLSAARNTGMEVAAHDLVVFLDADDILEPDAVSRLVAVWHSRSGRPVVVGSRGRMVDARGLWLTHEPEGCDGGIQVFAARDFILMNRFAPIVLADRRALLQLGGFDPALKASEDRDMWVRAATAGEVLLLRSTLHRKRDHVSSMSKHARRQTEAIFRVLEKARQNPAIRVPASTWRQAKAICFFQSARMYLAAGDRGMALRQCLRSLLSAPWLVRAGAAGFPLGFRTRFLLLQAAAFLGIRRTVKPARDASANTPEEKRIVRSSP